MSDRLEISSGEHGLIRVFTLDLPLVEAEALMEDEAQGLRDLTGATALDTDHIDLFDMNDLSGMPLADYLSEGHGVAPEEIAPMRAQLDRVKGRVLVLRSSAFERIGQTLRVLKPLRWIATFGEARGAQSLEPLHSDAAKGPLPPPTPSTQAPTPVKRIGSLVLVAGAIVIVLLALVIVGAVG